MDPQDDHKIGQLHSPAALTAATILGQDPIAYNRDILSYFLAQNYRYVYGHFAFSKAAYDVFKDKYAFVTVLRDPVKKWFSLYFYNRYKKSNHYALNDDLDMFLESELAVGYGSDYAMQFAGDDTITDFTSQEAIDRAISNLKLFDLVGVMEQFPVFVQGFQSLIGVDLKIRHLRKNPVSHEEQRRAITPEILERVQELNRPNLAIYEYVCNHLIDSYRSKPNSTATPID